MLEYKSEKFSELQEHYVLLPVDFEVWLSDESITGFLEANQHLAQYIYEEAMEQGGVTSPSLSEMFAIEGTDFYVYVAPIFDLADNKSWALAEIIKQIESVHLGSDSSTEEDLGPIAICNIGDSTVGQLCGAIPADLRAELEGSNLQFVMYLG